MKPRDMLLSSARGNDDFTPPGVCSADSMLDFDGGGGDTGSRDGGDGNRDKTDQGAAADGRKTEAGGRVVEFNGERLEVPDDLWDGETGAIRAEAAVKRALDLRRKLSEKPAAPESYQLVVPDDLKEKVEANAEHPLAKPAMEWARKHGLTQDAFAELTGLFYAREAAGFDEDARFATEQNEALAKALGENAEKVKKELGQWVGGLLGGDFKENPALLEAAGLLASDANGVLLIKALKDKIGERGIPSGRDRDSGAVSEADLKALQASDAYRHEHHPQHEATVAKVREGWKRLYPE